MFGVFGRRASRRGVKCCAPVIAIILSAIVCEPRVIAQTPASEAADLVVAPAITSDPILFGADDATRWTKGSYDVWILRGRCYVQQGETAAEAQSAVLWVKRALEFDHERNTVLAYLEGDVRIIDGRSAQPYEMRDRMWYGEFTSTMPLAVRTPSPREGEPTLLPQVFTNAQAYRDSLLKGPPVRPAQYVAPPTTGPMPSNVIIPPGTPGAMTAPEAPPSTAPLVAPAPRSPTGGVPPLLIPGASTPPPVVAPAPSGRRLRAFSRSSVKVQVKWIPSPNAQEWVGLISPGVNLIIDGLDGFGAVDVAADRLVVWTAGAEEPDLSGRKLQGGDRPLEIYMEGNIVFREGDRVIYADRMYYNVNTHVGTILNADMLGPAPSYDGVLRMKADVVRQIGANRFEADRAFLTSSRMSNPRYRLQVNQASFIDESKPAVSPFTGEPIIDPTTGEQIIEHNRLATGRNNLVYLGPVPVFYWPKFSADLDDPRFYVRNVSIKNDQIFGQQVLFDLDVFQMLGNRSRPAGTDWIASLDYLSKRGPAGGTTFSYQRDGLFGFPGPSSGFFDTWVINDTGADTLGSDRKDLPPPEDFRYRLFGRHRHQLPDHFQFTAELGLVADRNFLEQFYEMEWDTFKDETTGIELKQLYDNTSWSIAADVRLNDYFTQTTQLPRFDQFWLGESLVGDSLTWFQHTSAMYAELGVAQTPTDPVETVKFQLRPWEVATRGERIVTAQELDLPLTLGPAKFVPYVMGQAGHWGQVINGDDEQRLYGQAGIRAAIPFWSVNPDVRSDLFNLNGLAHKVVFDVDASFADANRNVDQFPLFDNLDDDSQEAFRHRFWINTFGGVIPPQFDERQYALRSGLGSNVTNPSAEIEDDMAAVRLGLRQRWQTKRGPPMKQRIIDWVTLDTEAVWFPRANRDNFGQDFGLVRYDFRWHVGDRLTFLSDGGFDFFDQGQQTISAGMQLSRPTNGSLYLGYRSLAGPFNMQVFISSLHYRLSPKWAGMAAISYDFSGSGTMGNAFSLTRIGESFLLGANFSYDAYKDNFTAMITFQPRFLSMMSQKSLGGVTVPPVGTYGLE
jgi:hypothetical protein